MYGFVADLSGLAMQFPELDADLPPAIREMLGEYEVVRQTGGASGATVYRLYGQGSKPDLFLKCGTGAVAREMSEEALRLDWLQARIPAPAVRYFKRSGPNASMLTNALTGSTVAASIVARPADAARIVASAACFLRQLHAIPASTCPFSSDLAERLRVAQLRIDGGLVDEADFDDERAGWSAQQVLDAIVAMQVPSFDRVVTHGDFTVDNLLVDGTEVTGCVDVGRLGVADRYQDVALFWRDLGAYGPELQQSFLESYGIQDIDEPRRDVHLLLDELF